MSPPSPPPSSPPPSLPSPLPPPSLPATLLEIDKAAQALNQVAGSAEQQQQRVQQREDLVAQLVSGLPAEAAAFGREQATQLIMTAQALSRVPTELSPKSATGLIELLASATEGLRLSGASSSVGTAQAAVDSVSSMLESSSDVRAAVSDAPVGVRSVLRSVGGVLAQQMAQQTAAVNASAASGVSGTMRLQSTALTLAVSRAPAEAMSGVGITLRNQTRLTLAATAGEARRELWSKSSKSSRRRIDARRVQQAAATADTVILATEWSQLAWLPGAAPAFPRSPPAAPPPAPPPRQGCAGACWVALLPVELFSV